MRNLPYYHSQFYVPKSKAILIKMIKPLWNGKYSDLQKMNKKQILAIFYRLKREQLVKIMNKKQEVL